MALGEIINFVGVILVGIGLMITWNRNGRNTAEKYGALTEQVKQSNSKLDEHHQKLDAIQAAVSNQAVNCATISSTLIGKIKSLEETDGK